MQKHKAGDGRASLTFEQNKVFENLFGEFGIFQLSDTELTLDLSLALRTATVGQLLKLRRLFPRTERLYVDKIVTAKEHGRVDERAVTDTARHILNILQKKRNCALHIARLIIDEVLPMEQFFSKVLSLAEQSKIPEIAVRDSGTGGTVVAFREVISDEEVDLMEAATE